MSLIDHPIRVDRVAERISVFNGGATLDFNGNEALRREAMAFYEQTPKMALILRALCSGGGVSKADAEAVLRDAGVLP